MGLFSKFKNLFLTDEKTAPQTKTVKKTKITGRKTVKKSKKNKTIKKVTKKRKKILKNPKKKPKKKVLRKKSAPKLKKKKRLANKKPLKPLTKIPQEKEIGVITHYFGKISVGIVKLKSTLRTGEKIRIKGTNDDFIQTVKSMQINHKAISMAGKGSEIGIKVSKPVHENDRVYLTIRKT